jgi:hypothetical protein
MDSKHAATAYRTAAVAAVQHQEAAGLAADAAARARETLAAIDPAHAVLQLKPADMADIATALTLHPMQMLVELFLKPQNPHVHGVAPQTALLAGSLAVGRVGPSTASVPEILRRVVAAGRVPPGLER